METLDLQDAARPDLIIPLDTWLARAFTPHRLHDTISRMHAAQPAPDPASDAEDALREIAECDAKIARYREALEAGTDPKLIAQWTAETQARHAQALAQTRRPTGDHRLSKEDIHAMITSLGSIRDVLADAEPQDKADVYQNLGLRLTYDPGKTAGAGRGSARPAPVGDTVCGSFTSSADQRRCGRSIMRFPSASRSLPE